MVSNDALNQNLITSQKILPIVHFQNVGHFIHHCCGSMVHPFDNKRFLAKYLIESIAC